MRGKGSMVVHDDFKQHEITPAFPPQLLIAFQFQPHSVAPHRKNSAGMTTIFSRLA
ncbi:hypothetical protein [Kaarinaea lacus]